MLQKIMKVKKHNVKYFDYTKLHYLKVVMANRFVKNDYTHVLYKGVLYSNNII